MDSLELRAFVFMVKTGNWIEARRLNQLGIDFMNENGVITLPKLSSLLEEMADYARYCEHDMEKARDELFKEVRKKLESGG